MYTPDCRMEAERQTGLGDLSIIPPEIRRLVWSPCLHLGVVEPYSYPFEEGVTLPSKLAKESPSVALLLVSKIVNREAKPFVYANIFQFNNVEAISLFAERPIWPKDVRLRMRGASIAFREIDYDEAAANEAIEDAREETLDRRMSGEIEDLNQPFMDTGVHKYSKIALTEIWRKKLDQAIKTLRPDQLYIDLTDSFCYPRMCCSLHVDAVRVMREVLLEHPSQPYTFSIFGQDSKEILSKTSRERVRKRARDGNDDEEIRLTRLNINLHKFGLSLEKRLRIQQASGVEGHQAVKELGEYEEVPEWVDRVADEELLRAPSW